MKGSIQHMNSLTIWEKIYSLQMVYLYEWKCVPYKEHLELQEMKETPYEQYIL